MQRLKIKLFEGDSVHERLGISDQRLEEIVNSVMELLKQESDMAKVMIRAAALGETDGEAVFAVSVAVVVNERHNQHMMQGAQDMLRSILGQNQPKHMVDLLMGFENGGCPVCPGQREADFKMIATQPVDKEFVDKLAKRLIRGQLPGDGSEE